MTQRATTQPTWAKMVERSKPTHQNLPVDGGKHPGEAEAQEDVDRVAASHVPDGVVRILFAHLTSIPASRCASVCGATKVDARLESKRQ